MKVLWLASWYPSKVEPYNGDFVQRHAEAASLYHNIEVIHVVKDAGGVLTRSSHTETTQRGKLKERIVYYYSPLEKVPFLGRVHSLFTYRKQFRQQIKAYLQENGKPDLVHVHVCMNAGMLALWLKRKYSLPYVVTEHASHFLPEAQENIGRSSLYNRLAIKMVLQQARGVTVVSRHLGKAVQLFAAREYEVIPNVVNTAIFTPANRADDGICRFIHVSSLDDLKNPETILEAFALLTKRVHSGISLDIVGPEKRHLRDKAKELGLEGVVEFYEEMPQTELATYMQRADALILFSRYETFGCVVIEANACGVPVIVSDIPVMREIVTDRNGIILQNNPAALAEALELFLENKVVFDKMAIANHAEETYGYKKIGAAFSRFYEAVAD